MEQKISADSVAAANLISEAAKEDSVAALSDTVAEVAAANPSTESLYEDPMLDSISKANPSYYEIENDKLKITCSTKGAQVYKVNVKNYYTYDSLELDIVKPGLSKLDYDLYVPQHINTSELNFRCVDHTDTSVTMRLSFADSSYIDDTYSLAPGSYLVDNSLHFVGMDRLIPRNYSNMKMSWDLTIPRFEKGYKNERQYSKVALLCPGETKTENLNAGRRDNAKKSVTARVRWFDFQQQFFSAIMVAPKDFSSLDVGMSFYPEDDPDKNLMACSASARVEMDKSPDFTVPFQFYFGPNHYGTMKSYHQDFEKVIQFGGWLIGGIVKVMLIPIFNWLNKYISNYGIIILIMTIMLQLIFSPLTRKSYMSSAKMKLIKPEVDKINEKYPRQEDAMKKQQATMDLYKRCGISMWGGCLPMLIQFPLLWAMFRFFPVSFELRQSHFLWCKDLSTYDSIWDFGVNIPLYGNHMSLFALLMAITTFFYAKMNAQNTASSDPSASTMNFMSVWFMPIFLLIFCNNLSAGLSYYYMISNLITIIVTLIIRKFFINEGKLNAQIHARANSKAPVKKSAFQKRLDEAMKAQQQQMKNQGRR
jgi:YidC/Oxa1 family membrane protein insertase